MIQTLPHLHNQTVPPTTDPFHHNSKHGPESDQLDWSQTITTPIIHKSLEPQISPRPLQHLM